MAEKQWAGTTYGNSIMHRWLIALLRNIDVRVFYIFAYIFVVPPCLFRPGFKPIYHYFRTCYGYGPLKAFCKTYQNHGVFAQAIIDKFAMYAGCRFNIDIEGYDYFKQLCTKPEGFIQLSSHIGNYEIAGYSLTAKEKPINALVYFGEKESIMNNRSRMFEHTNIRMIPVRQDMSHMFAINNALSAGEIVSIPADRIWGSPKAIAIDFLGRTAHFPEGPFRVAISRSLPVIAVHVMKTSALHYHIHVTPLKYDTTASKQQQVQQLAEQYVKELERIVRQYPTQWYNYYDFWK